MARHYNVQPKQLRSWRKTFEQHIRCEIVRKGNNCTVHGGRNPNNGLYYINLLEFMEELRSRGMPVSYNNLSVEYIRLENDDNNVPDIEAGVHFKNIYDRIRRFCRRCGITVRKGAHVAQNTRYVQKIMEDFVEYINTTINIYNINKCNVINMDETNIPFDLTVSSTLENIGTRTINIQTSGNSNRCIVMLTVILTGDKLPAYIIFKGTANSTIARHLNHGFPEDVICTCQSEG